MKTWKTGSLKQNSSKHKEHFFLKKLSCCQRRRLLANITTCRQILFITKVFIWGIDLIVINENFFEPFWVELSGLSVNKILINISYCQKNLGNYFIDELISETSSAYSITREILLFGNFKKLYQQENLFDKFASNFGLTLSNTEKSTQANSQGVTLIDHWFSSKNLNKEVQIFPISWNGSLDCFVHYQLSCWR